MKRALLTLALCLALAACHDGTASGAGAGSSAATPARKSTMNDKLNIQRNPQPKMRYELTLTIQDAPGPFESVTGHMQYEVENERCSPENPISGTYGKRPYKDVPIEFTRTGDNTYTGTVYLDLLRDEDYYGLGVCRWKMVAAIVAMTEQDVTFSPDIPLDKIATQQSKTLYFPKKAYRNASLKGSGDGGMPMSEIVAQYRNDFFSATLTAKENFQ
jgi:hypothetical protein